MIEPISRDVTFRRRAECAPLRPELFATIPPDAIKGYHYYNFSIEPDPFWSFIVGTKLNIGIGPSLHGGYEVEALFRGAASPKGSPFVHESLNRSDAEVVLVVINKEGVRYTAPVHDPVFAARARLGSAVNKSKVALHAR